MSLRWSLACSCVWLAVGCGGPGLAARTPSSQSPSSQAPSSQALTARPAHETEPETETATALTLCVPSELSYTCETDSSCAMDGYRAGSSHLAGERFADAFVAFDAAFDANPASPLAGDAAMLALDSLTLRMRSIDTPNDCAARMEEAVARYHAAHCAGAASSECELLDRLACRIEMLATNTLAETHPAAASMQFEALAGDPGCAEQRADFLYNAAVAADRAGDPARAAALRSRRRQEHPDQVDLDASTEPAPPPPIPIVDPVLGSP